MSSVIDIEACNEFMQEIRLQIDTEELNAISRDLELKSHQFNRILDSHRFDKLDQNDLDLLFSKIFVLKRKHKQLYEKYTFRDYRHGLFQLLYGDGKVDQRFSEFYHSFEELPVHWRVDLAGEVLHFTHPDKYWLISRWLWDNENNTGVLPILKNETFELNASSPSSMYLSVGQLMAHIRVMAESDEFDIINRSLFGSDVFLSCVYVIYAYTVLKIKMTDEFNKVMPGLTEFSRRILGIYNSKEMTVIRN